MDQIPVNEVLEMLRLGKNNQEISSSLEQRGYSLQQISDAINQADIKLGVEGNMPPSGMQPSAMDNDIPIPNGEPYGQQQSTQQSAQQNNYYPESNYQPSNYQLPQQQQGTGLEDIHAIVEEVVEEKWKDFIKNVGNIAVWKVRMADDLDATKQELVRTQRRLEELQVAVLGKVKDYNESIVEIGSDMKALENVFKKILEPLTENIKELKSVAQEFKGKHH